MELESRRPDVSESYASYDPPKGTAKLVVSLLDNVPSRVYIGLAQVCLADASSLSRARRRLKTTQKARVGETRAVYWPPSIREPARIEIFVDKVLSQLPSIFRKIEFFRELVIAQVLFHELGHHLQAQRKVRLRRMKEEGFAEAIAAKLLRRLINRKYKFLKPFIAVLNMGLDVRDKFMDVPKNRSGS
ncbi:MAG: hypothetical protein KF693_03280 [Nitrospira sp.]|nr:hypothetical protein [Nitrospira sp.]